MTNILCMPIINLTLYNFTGFGVFTTAFFQKGAFLLEYVGNRISEKEAEIRERKRRKKKHSYMFHFKWNGKHV